VAVKKCDEMGRPSKCNNGMWLRRLGCAGLVGYFLCTLSFALLDKFLVFAWCLRVYDCVFSSLLFLVVCFDGHMVRRGQGQGLKYGFGMYWVGRDCLSTRHRAHASRFLLSLSQPPVWNMEGRIISEEFTIWYGYGKGFGKENTQGLRIPFEGLRKGHGIQAHEAARSYS
jgi:hypothetical protein